MSIRRKQAIAGVSAGVENVVMTVYPSIASTRLGRWLGRRYNSIPIKINGIKLSYLLFPLPSIPFALLLYFQLKVIGSRYILTNRAVTIRAALGEKRRAETALPTIDRIEVRQYAGQEFYRAADLVFYDSGGNVLGRLAGVPYAEIFRQTILEARDALTQTEAALATIAARQTA
jgi:hypothetical protein